MKLFKRVVAALVGVGIAAGAAQAQNLDQRHYNQQRRVEQGIRHGSVTPREAHRIEHQQRSIDRQEARLRDRNGGHLTRYDRARLRHRENRASRHIYRAKHNGRHY
jgi:hypothetical protein